MVLLDKMCCLRNVFTLFPHVLFTLRIVQLATLSERRAAELEARLHEQEGINRDMLVRGCVHVRSHYDTLCYVCTVLAVVVSAA